MKKRRGVSLLYVLLLVVSLAGRTVAEEEEPENPAAEKPESVVPSDTQSNVYRLPQMDANKVNLFEPFAQGNELSGRSRWVRSQSKKDKADAAELEKYDGEWAVEDANISRMEGDFALILKSAAKHHGIAVKLDKPYVFSGKPFVFQYDVKFANGQECGGGYVKLIQHKTLSRLEDLNDKTPYTIMFGPDKCGKDAHLRFIFQHRNPRTGAYEEKHWKEPATLKIEELISSKKTHLYTLVVQPDNTFKVFVDQKIVGDGSLLKDVSPEVNPPAEIEDPNDSKPGDWDERKTVSDVNAKKPDDWDVDAPSKISDPSSSKPEGWSEDEPEMIHDLDVAQPEDWDVEMDGDWEAPLIENPKCKGVGCGKWTAPLIDNPKCKSGGCGPWSAPMIDNPAYKGKWTARKIPNPDFYDDTEPYKMTTIDALALELWSISNNVYFDNLLITDDIDVADKIARETWAVKAEMEGATEPFLGGKVNYKYMGIIAAVVIGLGTLIVMRKKNRAQARASHMEDIGLPDQYSDEDAPVKKVPVAKKPVKQDEEEEDDDDDDIPPPGLEGDEGAGDNPDSASASVSDVDQDLPSGTADEAVPETKEPRVTKRKPRRE